MLPTDPLAIPIFDEGKIAVYIHWAFCQSLCPYCDFNSYVSVKPMEQQQWLQGYLNAFELQKPYWHNKVVKSIFFGGGTPSLMDPNVIHKIITYFTQHNKSLGFNQKIPEITLESNPSTFEVSKFQDFKDAGVNRLSTGVQSFNADNLMWLGRKHSVVESIYALEKSHEIFGNTSFDLIMGLPNQTLANFLEDLTMACKLSQQHISIYQLTIEKGTVFYKQKVPEIGEKLGEKFYRAAIEELAKVSLAQYEISNFAKTGFASKHNLHVWQGGEYIGIGPNASGRVFLQEWYGTREFKNPKIWLAKALEHKNLCHEQIAITQQERFEEVVLTTFRLNKAIPPYLIQQLPIIKINKLVAEGLLHYQDTALCTTLLGRMCLNYVIQTLLI